MKNNKFISLSFKLSVVLGVLATLLCAASNFMHVLIIGSLFAGFAGFVFCCIHIVAAQRNEGAGQAKTAMLILSLLLNSAPLLFMAFIIWYGSR